MNLEDAIVRAGVALWLVSVISFVRIRRLVRERYPEAWARHGSPLFVPVLDRRRWSRASARFWWSGYRALGDRQVDRAMAVARASFAGVVALAALLLVLTAV